jgi:mono/diheme cytochrome c family protein
VYSNSDGATETASASANPLSLEAMLKPNRASFILLALSSLISILILCACDAEPHKTDAELQLNGQQAAGRRIYETRCAECHFAYIDRSLKGPSLQGLFKKPYMKNGMPANDDRVTDIIMIGRGKMPAFQNKLTQQQLDDLMAYLHTL